MTGIRVTDPEALRTLCELVLEGWPEYGGSEDSPAGEFAAFTWADPRPRTYLLLDRRVAEIASGYDRGPGSLPDFSVLDPESVKAAARA